MKKENKIKRTHGGDCFRRRFRRLRSQSEERHKLGINWVGARVLVTVEEFYKS